ncbi:hypothetical protein [Mycolicibacterium sp. lyk4-40-TYG-92]|uniref:hypothetical protein n=1 Tax=Mycolicibacterium sp. lyk4-40-TYG-92 TaxID=3040295 RepID=UPI002550F5E2|nr:hypothetical protein [Mycolicibacterium sp. lyk4-40-TYG-92]
MLVFGLSSRRLAATAVVFAVSVASCGYGAGIAIADPQPMPDRWTQFVTDDGWVVDVNTTNESRSSSTFFRKLSKPFAREG